MKYEVQKSKTKYIGFLSLVDGMVCFCTIQDRKEFEEDNGKVHAHYSAILDEDCDSILKREGESESLITGHKGDVIGIREIPPLRDLADFMKGTHLRITLLGTSYRGEGKKSPRHDIEIAVGVES